MILCPEPAKRVTLNDVVPGTCEAGGRIKPGAQAPGSVIKIGALEPVKRATALGEIALSPASRARRPFLITLPWGLRPRLYAATCFAGFAHNVLRVTYFAGSGHNILGVTGFVGFGDPYRG